MPQFMTNNPVKEGERTILVGEEAHHIKKVLRLKKDDWIILSDGKGSRYRGKIEKTDKKSIQILVESKLEQLQHKKIILAQAVIKHDKTEFIIQKAVELGITRIVPFTSKRTVPKYGKNIEEKKLKRWNKIAFEAAKQCGSTIKPEVKPIIPVSGLFNRYSNIPNKIIFFEGEQEKDLKTYFSDFSGSAGEEEEMIIVIGPEGGFEKEEIKEARNSGFKCIGLGKLIMRVETASLAAITLIQYHLGQFDIKN